LCEFDVGSTIFPRKGWCVKKCKKMIKLIQGVAGAPEVRFERGAEVAPPVALSPVALSPVALPPVALPPVALPPVVVEALVQA
jgi:hypothetical protein